jgi:YggT family protein
MFAIGNLIKALADVLSFALTLYMWLIVARALVSWVNPDPYNPIVRFLYSVTEPLMSRVRRWVPLVFGGLDLSPVLIILVIYFLNQFLVSTLYQLAAHFG